jgi:PAS domain S-box-containing protein
MSALGEERHGPLRILIVEDDPDHRYLLVRTLEAIYRDGARIVPVGSLREAEEALHGDRFSCLLLDLTLTDATGTKGLEALRALTDTPIIVLTGRSDLGVKALESGANAFLQKADIDTARIARAIEDVMTTAGAVRERAHLAAIVESAQLAMFLRGLDGTIVTWNPGAEEIFGYTRDEIVGRNWTDIVPVALLERERAFTEMVLAGEHVSRYETQRLRKDGTLIDVGMTLSATRGADGAINGVSVIARDITREKETQRERDLLITERKATQHELERRGAQLAEAQRIARLGLFDLDVGSGEVNWSDEMFRLFGYEPGQTDVTIDLVFEMMEDDSRELLQHILEQAIAERGDFEVELVARKIDGSRIDFAARGTVVEDPTGSLRVIGSAQDITERQRLEEQLLQSQKMEALGGLAGGIAHDFNNLLAIILNYGQFIADDLPDDSRLRGDLDAIVQAAQRGSALVKQLLAFSRKEVVRPEVVNVNLLISQMQPMLRRLVRESIVLEENLAPDAWDTTADKGQLEQVLLNLFVNARDAMPDGGKILVSTSNVVADEAFAASHPDFREGRFACMTVSDTGSGMSKETQTRIFEPFFTTKAIGGGTGLGLATVYGIVKRCGGFISVYSEIGLGTTFKIYLPATFLVRKEEEFEPVQLSMTGRGERIVVVEDEDSVLSLITRILGENHYDVVPMSSPDEALHKLQNDDEVALLLTDVVMPQMSGRALSEAADVPTVFMSGYTDSIIEEQGVLQEGVIFLPKPFTAEELLRVVRSAIDERTRADRAMAVE